jgi:outer membrane protein OmpA-like peptidoglycan-associated protein
MRSLIHRLNFYCLMIIIPALASGCNPFTRTQRGAAIGAGAGATVGAVIGKAAGNPALGAIIGGAVGGTAGAYIGSKMDRQASEIRKTVPGASVLRRGDGIIIRFDNDTLFDAGSANIRVAAQVNLQHLAVTMQKFQYTTISVSAYTDSTGDVANNVAISEKRAVAVKNVFASNGIPDSRLTAFGLGEADPITSNRTPQGRMQNNRLEIIIAGDELKASNRRPHH